LSNTACIKCRSNLDAEWHFCPFCGSAKEKEKAQETAEKQKVLIVDDEFGILKMVELALKPLEVDVYTAQNGREALEKVQSIRPSLVITDINMPVMDGYDLIKELRSKVNTMFIPIVILSSRDTVEDKLKGFTFGTDDYITKPFDYTELQARVKRLLKRSGN
jgi:DNA-binding response OmpR family regulator